METKNCVTTVFILFILLAAPAFSRGWLKLKTEKLNSEIYQIDYRGPETHSYWPPPNRSGGINTNGVPQQNLKANGRSKRPSTENAIKKGKKVHG